MRDQPVSLGCVQGLEFVGFIDEVDALFMALIFVATIVSISKIRSEIAEFCC